MEKLPKLRIERFLISNKAIIGKLYNEKGFFCYTLENPWLNNHENISCIPVGTYFVNHHISPKLLQSRQENGQCFILNQVKDRYFILFHIGNYAKDTEGCILVGNAWGSMTPPGEKHGYLAVKNSRVTFKKLLALYDKFELTIMDEV